MRAGKENVAEASGGCAPGDARLDSRTPLNESACAISIIVPTFNEAATVERLQDQLDEMDLGQARCEVIFVDGGSDDGTPELIRSSYRLIKDAPPGRGPALNAGARAASGEVLFFLHCDSVLPRDALGEIRRVLSRRRAGSFGIRFDRETPVLLACRVMSNLRIRFRHISYGDQGLFIDRALFFELGGFPEVPLMEDYVFALSLKAAGVKLGLARRRIVTSSRRFPPGELARLRTWVGMARIRSLYRHGVPEDELARIYGEAR